MNLAERFWSKVDIRGEEECWLWTAATNGKPGYGAIGVNGKGGGIELAHRMSWMLVRGDIPSGLSVLHRCDNRICVNPQHLFLGTQADNMLDMRRKGREARVGATGERNRGAKLTTQQVQDIRQQHNPRTMSYRMLAERYGVHRTTIRKIVKAKTWAHI